MAKTIQEDFLYKKVYEFSYAALAIASSFRTESSGRTSAKNKEIAGLFENKAVSLLDSILIADYEKTKNIVHSIIALTGLLVDSGNLHPVNREILIRESEKISLAIEALPMKKKETLQDLNLSKIFSKSVLPLPIKKQNTDQSAKLNPQSKIADNDSTQLTARGFADEIADKAETRQSAIIEKLRQTENLPGQQAGLPADKAGCRLNELQAIFPDVSERTLRYDLESLISRGLVERVGSRRNSFYKIKNGVGAVIELPGHLAKNTEFME